MTIFTASYFKNRKAQLKIQQMAFVLMAVFVFFAIVAVFYLSIRTAGVEKEFGILKQNEAKELVIKIASSPEFSWKSGKSSRAECINCVDFDKMLALKYAKDYDKLWHLDYLAIRKVYPSENGSIECSLENYPDCNVITLIEKQEIGTPEDAFISLCRWESEGYRKCEIGKIYVSGEISK